VARSADSRRRAHEGGAAIVASVEELPNVDGIVVATPTATHSQVVRSVLPRQVPIFVEKPLTNSAADAAALADADGLLFLMDKWRYHPGVRELGRIARAGELGPVVGLQTTRVGWDNPHDDVDSVWVLAPHDLASGLEILGTLLPARAALAELDGDRVVGLIAQCGTRPWHSFEVSTRRREKTRSARLLCRDGIAELADSFAEHVRITRGQSTHRGVPPDPELRPIMNEMPLLLELQQFVQYLDGGPPPISGYRDGAAVVQVLSDLRRLAGLTD
jgi:predicted dehydrogenase